MNELPWQNLPVPCLVKIAGVLAILVTKRGVSKQGPHSGNLFLHVESHKEQLTSHACSSHFPNPVFPTTEGQEKSASMVLKEFHCIQNTYKIQTSSRYEEIARFLDAVLLDGAFQTGTEFC